jgi:N-acetylglucosaminyl-diphospho-decaprenol L-rhamnosyltransferase
MFQMSIEPWVRIIIVNYNSGSLLQDCVSALEAQTMRDFEVIIFDNNSTDRSIEDLRLPDDRFRVRRSGVNLGFAAANNRAAEGCRSRWIATLNADTRPFPTWLEALRKATERHPWAHAFGSTQLKADDPTKVDGFGDVFCFWGFAWRGCGDAPVSTLPDDDREVFAPCAAAALYSREVFQALGGFDESFFCYLEDVDIGFRIRLKGLRCVQVRKAEIIHIGSAITGLVSDFTIFHSYRNRVWMLVKNFPAPLFFPMIVVHIPLVYLTLRRSRDFSRRAAVRGMWMAILGIPQALRSRRQIQRDRAISSFALGKMMVWDLRKVSTRSPHFIQMTSHQEGLPSTSR